MICIDLKDAYLQVPTHPNSPKFLRFAPQVFSRVMALVSAMLHSQAVKMLRYLDDWLVIASTHQEALQARDAVLQLCSQLGIDVNLEKSCLTPSQTATYLGMVLVSPSLRAFLTEKRVCRTLTVRRVSLLQAARCAYLEVSSRPSSFSVILLPGGVFGCDPFNFSFGSIGILRTKRSWFLGLRPFSVP